MQDKIIELPQVEACYEQITDEQECVICYQNIMNNGLYQCETCQKHFCTACYTKIKHQTCPFCRQHGIELFKLSDYIKIDCPFNVDASIYLIHIHYNHPNITTSKLVKRIMNYLYMVVLQDDDDTIISMMIEVLENLDQFTDINYIQDNIGSLVYGFDNVQQCKRFYSDDFDLEEAIKQFYIRLSQIKRVTQRQLQKIYDETLNYNYLCIEKILQSDSQ